jgi:LysR family transcriptional regulator for bpeEF and oprC
MIVPALGDFLKRYPEIDLEVGCTDRQVDLLQEGVDCVIRGGSIVDESLVARRLGAMRMLTCATPAYLRAFGTPTTLEDIERHRAVHYASPKSGKMYGFEYVVDGQNVTVFGQQRMAINDSDACVEAALAGIGLIQMPEFIVNEQIAAGKLSIVLEDFPTEALPFWILYPQNRHLSTKVRAFVEWAAELFAKANFVDAAAAPSRRRVATAK